jgi:hypothetical protein
MPTRRGSDHRAEYVIVELQHVPDSTRRVQLIAVSTEGGDWIEKEVIFPAFHAS